MSLTLSGRLSAMLRVACRTVWLVVLPSPALAALEPSPSSVRFAEVDLPGGVRMHYAEGGDATGRAVILLHGYGDSWFSYSRVLPLLPGDFRIIAPDLRGHGRTSQPDSGYALRDLATDVLALMDALGIERAVVVGHSMGGLVAQQVALLAPKRVSGIMLVATATEVSRFNKISDLEQAVGGLVDPIPEAFVREFQGSMMKQPLPQEFFERVIAESHRLSAHVWKAVMYGMLATGAPAGLAGSGIPALIVWGAHDPWVPRKSQDDLLAQFPGSKLNVYDDVAHTPNWERPERFAQDLERFVRSVPAAAAQNARTLHDAPELLDGLGDHQFSIKTRIPLAQRYFDQGLRLVYAFNHAEAVRAFRHAA
jgi:non-heme chloroperoxidase